jgi:hypothetical protein
LKPGGFERRVKLAQPPTTPLPFMVAALPTTAHVLKSCATFLDFMYLGPALGQLASGVRHHGVALQVAFERQTLKPAFHLIGVRLWV